MYGAAIRVLVCWREELVLVETPVLVIDSIVEGDDDHLRNICREHPTRNKSSIRRAEAVWEGAICIVTRWSSIGVMSRVTPTLVTVILAVWVTVTE